LANPGFEEGTPGQTPPGWFVPKALAEAGFRAALTTNEPSQGRQCVEIRFPVEGKPPPGTFANLMQRMDAQPWRGKRVRITSAIRLMTDTPEGRAQMWARVDRSGGGMGGFDNMGDRPVTRASWSDYSVAIEVAEDAQALNVGLMAFDGATACWDDIRMEVTGSFQTLTEPPRAVTATGLSNLVAFARLLGYVRHFHPSDQAATNDWLWFAVKAMPEIENAPGPDTLAKRLETTFQSVAPSLRVFPVGQQPGSPAELQTPKGKGPWFVRVWEHSGYGQQPASRFGTIYRSERLKFDATDISKLPAYAQSANVFIAELGAGVACMVPTAIFADENGTLPRPAALFVPPDPSNQLAITHRTARLATVMLMWNVLEHFYPYFDVVETDWSRELGAALRSAATDSDEAAFYRTLNRLVVALQDGHGTLGGPGAPSEAPLPLKVEWVEDQVVVTAVSGRVENVEKGDVIESIDGVPAKEAFAKLSSEVSAATPQRRKQVAFRFGWGLLSQPAKMEIRGGDDQVRTVSVPRRNQRISFDSDRPPKLHEIRPGVYYVDITRTSHEEFEAALAALAKAKGLVFDVRGYPAGSPKWLTHLRGIAMTSARWNVPKRHRPERTEIEWVKSNWDLQPAEPQLTTNRVFLTDGSAISYAETLMGIVEAYRLGEIVGEPTAGTNGNICDVELPFGYRFVFTGMKVLKHDGSRHHGVGIHPTVPVAKTMKGIRQGKDEQLERALVLVCPEGS
jgi:hypothetical protein